MRRWVTFAQPRGHHEEVVVRAVSAAPRSMPLPLIPLAKILAACSSERRLERLADRRRRGTGDSGTACRARPTAALEMRVTVMWAMAATARSTARDNFISLPEGFRYVVLAKAGTMMSDGRTMPYAHDGMTCFAGQGSQVGLAPQPMSSRRTTRRTTTPPSTIRWARAA